MKKSISISAKSIQLTSPQIGKAGELRVRSELILHGFSPATFDNDDGTDIIVGESGKKIQVKCSTRPQNNKNYGWKYSFTIGQTRFRNGVKGRYERVYSRKNYIGKADYFVFWCIEDDIFYVIPEDIIGEKISFVVPTPTENRTYRINDRKSKSKYEVYKNAWHLLA